MSLNISDTQRVTIWEIEDKGRFSLVRMSSSRKDKQTQEYKNSNWSFVRFVGKAHEKIQSEGLKRQDRIVLKGATISLEDYMEDGEKKYPKHPTITVFNWEYLESDGAGRMDSPPKVETSEDSDVEPEQDEDLPF